MKKLAALILVGILCMTTAFAAEWADGLSAAQPYPGKPAIDLEEMLGYMALYPNTRTNMSVEHFCDVLEMYFPREDIAVGEGSLTLFDESGEVAKISFVDADAVEVRPLEEAELEGLLWGGGTCVEVHLPVSMAFDTPYYVLMDENCLTAADGKVSNPPITNEEAWTPLLTGDYGISQLYYSAPVEAEDGEEAPADPAEAKMVPEVGDVITFELVMGGDAKTAVVYSENDSAYFQDLEYTESGTVTGTITGEDLDWGVVFLDEAGEIVEYFDLK